MSDTVYAIPLTLVDVDESLQPRCDGLDQAHIQALMETPDLWPPIDVLPNGDRFTVVNGFHRYEAATRLGGTSINARVVPWPQNGDREQLAFDLNASNAKALTLKDKKHRASRLLLQHPEYSDREISRLTWLNHETVGALRRGGNRQDVSRKPGELESDIGIFDPIRFSKATKTQKAVAGYIQRVAAALADPYPDKDGEYGLNGWTDDPIENADACYATRGPEKANELLAGIEETSRFLLAIARARKTLNKTYKEQQ